MRGLLRLRWRLLKLLVGLDDNLGGLARVTDVHLLLGQPFHLEERRNLLVSHRADLVYPLLGQGDIAAAFAMPKLEESLELEDYLLKTALMQLFFREQDPRFAFGPIDLVQEVGSDGFELVELQAKLLLGHVCAFLGE